jgi:hypothetical protein
MPADCGVWCVVCGVWCDARKHASTQARKHAPQGEKGARPRVEAWRWRLFDNVAVDDHVAL